MIALDPWSLAPWLMLALVALVLLGRLVRTRRHRRVAALLGLEGTVVYADNGTTRAFVSRMYGIKAKPDFVLRLRTGDYAVVEFKSRANGRLYESDVAQVKATALAVRSRFPVKRAFVMAGDLRHEIKLPADSKALHAQIATLAKYVRLAERDPLAVYNAHPGKCRACAHRNGCEGRKD
jgi:CRISPR/Cas system-associated exonuclease Cas4 (RecB family)